MTVFVTTKKKKQKKKKRRSKVHFLIYFLKTRVVCDIFRRNALYIGIVPLCLGILQVGSFIQGEFSLHLLQMSNMNYRWNPCKGNH